MNRVAMAVCVAVSLAAFSGITAAGQDRASYTPPGGPGDGGLMRHIRVSGTAGSLTHWAPVLGSGLYKSTDGGANWTPSGSGIDHRWVRSLRFNPTNSAVMYMATLGGRGFYKSTDSGANWSPSNAGLSCTSINNIIVVNGAGPNQGHLYSGTGCGGSLNGVYKSTDQGATWARVGFPTIPGTVSVGGIVTSSDGTLVIAVTNIGIYASFDSGVTWSQRNGTIPNVLSGPRGADVNDFIFTGTVWATEIVGNGIFWSEDSGVNWTPATGLPAGATTVGGGFSAIGANYWIFVDGAGPYRSSDGGKTWVQETTLFSGLPTQRVRSVIRDADLTWWSATLAGAYKSTDSGATWTRVSNGLPRGMVVNLSGHSSTPQIAFAVSDTLYKTTDGGVTWAPSDAGINGIFQQSSGRFGSVIVDPNNPATVYAMSVNKGVFKSTDNGVTWAPINTGINIPLIGNPANFRVAPSDSNVLWMTMGGAVFKSVNAGASWSNVSVPVQSARSPAVDPTNPNIVYVATGGGLFKTTDGGTIWFLSNPSFLNFSVSRAQVMSGAPQNVLLAAYNSSARDEANSVSGVYLSRNGGATWKQLVSNEKTTTAIFVNSPGGKVAMYVTTEGFFDHPVGDERVFKCVDLFADDWEPNTHCRAVDLGPNPGFVRSFAQRDDQLRAVATSSGLARNRFLHLGQDFNNDGRADIFWRNTSGANAIWHMNGSGFFDDSGVQTLSTVGSPWVVAGFGDFDGNGTSDVLWRNTSSGENYIYFMDGATILSEGFIRSVPAGDWSVAGVGDFDRDGKSDILWRNSASGDNYVYMMDGLTIASEGYIRSVPADWSVAAVGDFDGDFRADVLWRNGSTGENYVFQMNGLTIANEGYIRSVPTAWTVKGLGDFNLDNKMDIVWRNNTTGENYVYPMDGTAILPDEGYLPTVSEAGWNIAAVGDFDGEHTTIPGRGHSDILWRNSTSGAAYLWKMSGPTSIVSLCGAMGCQSGFLPLVGDTNWQIMNR